MTTATANSLELLRKASEFLVNQVSESGIGLLQTFGTFERFQTIATLVGMKALTNACFSADWACDMVCREGSFQRSISELWISNQAAA